jgi:tetratricopeptide (TPR) repeat protein
MDPYLLSLLTACLYIVVFGGLSLLRREGLSVQFALESVVATAVLVGGSLVVGLPISPILLLIVLYLVTMRSRLLVDIANLLARRRRYQSAFKLYELGLAWWPDVSARLIVLANRGAAELHSGQVDTAIKTFEGVLDSEQRPRLGIKYEAATQYNLAYAYEQAGDEAKAIAHYNEAIDVLPGSLYAKAAQAALKRRKKGQPGG